MIHIDDLVRQRLRGGEEPERPGAWLTMRELLDKEMPVQAGHNWRRIIGYFTALLLLTTASVGGYRMYNNHLAGTQVASSGGGGGRDGVGAYGAPDGGPVGNGVAATATGYTSNTAASTEKTNTSASSSAAVASNGSMPSSNAPIARDAADMAAPRSSAHVGVNHSTRASALGAAPAQQAALTTNTPAVTTQTAVAANNQASNNTPDAANADSRLYASSASATVRSHRTQKAPEHLPASGLSPLQAAATNVAINQPRPATVIVKHDTIERLEIVARRIWNAEAGHHYYRIDTFPAGKIVVDHIVAAPQDAIAANTETPARPKRHGIFSRRQNTAKTAGNEDAANNTVAANNASAKTEAASAPAPVVPNAAAPEAKTASQDVGLLAANAAVAATKSRSFRLWNAEKVQAIVDKFKNEASRLEVHPGIMAGINASMFTPNALGGFQLGLTSLFVINDFWSLMIEPKYILRFNTGSSVRDDYKQVVDNSGSITPDAQVPGNLLYIWTDKTIRHNLNYDMVNTIELPIMARYHWGQWYAQGGANLVFSQAINAKETTTALDDYKQHNESRPSMVPGAFITNDHPNVQLSDFGAHFGTGYVLSGGYMFSPAVYVDMRLTQTFWDNSKTAGAKQVSKDLLRTPSIQVSVGYRFGSKK